MYRVIFHWTSQIMGSVLYKKIENFDPIHWLNQNLQQQWVLHYFQCSFQIPLTPHQVSDTQRGPRVILTKLKWALRLHSIQAYFDFLWHLTDGNWQKWKRVFLTCPCHEIYRGEAVGLKSCKNTWKITIFVKMWNLGQYRENLIFCQ